MRLWPIAFIGKPQRTLLEQKRAAWAGVPAYRTTQPVETRKQWKPVLRIKRRSA